MSYNTWDLYGKKKLGKFTLAGELPIVSGGLGSGSYSTWALATEIDWKINENFTASFVTAFANPQTAARQAFDRTKNFGYGMVFLAYSY